MRKLLASRAGLVYTGLCALLILSACVDSDYELGDIDTTVRFSVEDLVVPVNLDTVTLEAVLDLEDDSKIVLTDGIYALVETGTYESTPIDVPSFTADSPDIDPIESELQLTLDALDSSSAPVRKSAARTGSTDDDDLLLFHYAFNVDSTFVQVVSTEVDTAILSVERVVTDDTRFVLELSVEGLESTVNELTIEGLGIHFIAGLECTVEGGIYDAETGLVTVTDGITTGHSIEVTFNVTAVDSRSGMCIDDDHQFIFSDYTIAFEGQISVYESQVKDSFFDAAGDLNTVALLKAIPDEIAYTLQPVLDDIVVTSFTGDISYAIQDLDIDPIELTGIPDVLNQTGTSISLENPQIYLSMSNPVYETGAYVQTGLTLTAQTDGTETPYELDEEFFIDADVNYYCLSPSKPDTYYNDSSTDVDFSQSEHLTFSTLGDILSGERIPDAIGVEVTNPRLPAQAVTDFPLSGELDPVEGVYVLYAPLELTEDARIVYTDTLDDWNDEDVDAIVITSLTVNADIYTDIPMTLDFIVYPITTGAKKVTDNGTTVVGTLDDVLVGGEETPIEISINGTVTHLDGIIFEARVTGQEESDVLQADQVIKMGNVKATVSGYYEKEL